MKVLHFRIDSPPGYNSIAIEKAFIGLGFEYRGINWQPYRFEYGVEKLRSDFVEFAKQEKPDIIFAHIQNPEVFDIDTWKELSLHGFLINYTFDVRFAENMNWMYEVAPNIGHTFFACMEDVANCKVRGIENVSHIHSSCDMDLFKPSQRRGLYAMDISFCGNRYDNTNLNFPAAKERQQMIEILERCYGGNRFIPYGIGQRGGLIPPESEVNVYNYSKIAINQNNFYLHGYTSDRIWRIMASGTFCLSAYFPGIEKIFQRGVHLDWFENFDEMKQKIDYYLGDDKERLAIAEVGSNFVRENHTWQNRISEMIKACNL